MMKKGLCGCDLRTQVTAIAVLYCALSLTGIVFGVLLLDSPESFALVKGQDDVSENMDITEATDSQGTEEGVMVTRVTRSTADTGNVNVTLTDNNEDKNMYQDEDFDNDDTEEVLNFSDEESIYLDETFKTSTAGLVKREITSEEELEEDIKVNEGTEDVNTGKGKHYHRLIKFIESEGVEVLIGSFLKLACSLLLLHGVRNHKHWLLVPWCVEELLEMLGGFLQFTVQALRTNAWGAGSVFAVILSYAVGGYFLYSVASYHVLLRRMNKNSDQIISSVSQGGFQDLVGGRNYRRLEEEAWQSEPNLGEEFRQHGFSREKKVDGQPEQDEHVLYVQ